MIHVLDASAAIAALLKEPGADIVERAISDAVIGSVNLAEVVTVFSRRDATPEQIAQLIETLDVPVLPGTQFLAVEAGQLWTATRSAGSSLGDRFALALSGYLGATLLTSDRRLAEIAPTVDVRAVLIR